MFILASGSSRRRDILELAGLAHEVVPSGVDESVDTDDPTEEAVVVALRKARAVARRHPDAVVIGADTTLAHDGASMGKPEDRDHAHRMLRRLSGTSCTITTGMAVVDGRAERTATRLARIRVHELDDVTIEDYLATGAGDDKAGTLEIQDRSAHFVDVVDGCPGTVIGLSVCALREDLDLDVRECHPDDCVAHYRRWGG